MNFLEGIYEMNFDKKLRELAICRYAFNTKTYYIMFNHVELLKIVGFNNNEILVIFKENPVVSLDEKCNFVCKVVDEFENNKGTLINDTY